MQHFIVTLYLLTTCFIQSATSSGDLSLNAATASLNAVQMHLAPTNSIPVSPVSTSLLVLAVITFLVLAKDILLKMTAHLLIYAFGSCSEDRLNKKLSALEGTSKGGLPRLNEFGSQKTVTKISQKFTRSVIKIEKQPNAAHMLLQDTDKSLYELAELHLQDQSRDTTDWESLDDFDDWENEPRAPAPKLLPEDIWAEEDTPIRGEDIGKTPKRKLTLPMAALAPLKLPKEGRSMFS